MSKLRLLLLAVVLTAVTGLGSASTPEPVRLNQTGCQNVAQAMGYGSLKQAEGDESPWIALKEPELYPDEFREHIRLLNDILRNYAKVDPQTHYEDYLQFCLIAEGDLSTMNKGLKALLKEVEI